MEPMTDRERYIAVESWEAGFAFARDLIADTLDDVRHAIFPPPRLTREERVRLRLELFERCAEDMKRELAAARERRLERAGR